MKKFYFKEILLATTNLGKIEELTSLLAEYDVKIYSLKDIEKVEAPIENGQSFVENAEIKSRYYSKFTNLPVLSDDSGFMIYDLGGFPGVHSARFAEESSDFANAFRIIEKKLENLELKTNLARFECALSICDGSSLKNFQGEVLGNLCFPARGDSGFGYDPIFVPNGYQQTFAQMDKQEKNLISHRYQAFKQFINYYQNI